MEKADISKLQADPVSLLDAIQATVTTRNAEAYAKQLDPAKHTITDKALRPDKTVTNDAGETSLVKVARLPIPFQKHIVNLAASFLVGNPIRLDCTPDTGIETDMLEVLRRSWADNKLDYKSKVIAKAQFAETEAAEIWYLDDAGPDYWQGTPLEGSKKRLRMRVASPKRGDALYPVFDGMGDLIAFGRGYAVSTGDKTEDRFEVYTDEKIIFLIKSGDGWEVTQNSPNPYGKIPAIYYSQDLPEWSDVQDMIERLEEIVSNLSDTNDYFGSPMVFVQGAIKGFAKKGERGKVLEADPGAKAEYLTWDQSPESTKLEINTLRSLIFDMTSTPDISIEQMKALGTYSGIALKMLFLAPHLKAADKEENFGECVQRRVNLMKAMIGTIKPELKAAASLDIRPRFEYYLPKDEAGLIDMLSTATGGEKTMSQKTAVSLNPLVSNADAELLEIQNEGSQNQIP